MQLSDAMQRHPVRALVTTPTLHNPTGATTSSSHRAELLALADRHGVVVIEDDVYGDLSVGDGPSPLAATDPRVLYCSSLSKTVAPGIRVGWVVCPERVPELVRARLASGITSPAWNQRVAQRFLGEGYYGRHLRRLVGALAAAPGCVARRGARRISVRNHGQRSGRGLPVVGHAAGFPRSARGLRTRS